MFKALTLSGVMAVCSASAAEQLSEGGFEQEAAPFAALVRTLADSAELPGGAVVVVRDGRVETSIPLGTRNGTDAVTIETVFRVASVSKVFTASAVARLVADGRLSLDADLRTGRPWLAAVAPGPDPVTLRGLLTHTAGFDDRIVGMFARTPEDLVPLGEYLLDRMPRRTTAVGRETRYNNHGAALAGLVVEETVGQPFDAAVAAVLFEPLGLTGSSFSQPLRPELADRVARAYRCTEAPCDPIPFDYRRTSPAGGMVTTPDDMGRFMRAVLDGGETLLGQGTVDLLTSRAWGIRRDMPGMALALHEQPVAAYRGLTHAGASSGYRSLLVLVPEAGAGLFIVTTGGASWFASAVLVEFERLLGGQRAVGGSPTPVASCELAEYEGVYLLGRAARRSYESFPGRFLFAHHIRADGNGYLVRSEAGRSQRYGRVADDRFAGVDGAGTMLFERNSAGRVVAVHAADVFNGARFPASYRRLGAIMEPRFVNELVSWLIGLPVLAILAWLVLTALMAWRRPHRPTRSLMAKAGLLLVAGTTASVLVFGFGFLARFTQLAASDPTVLAWGLPPELGRFLWMPWAIGICSVSLAGCALASWHRRTDVRLLDRLLFSLTGACMIIFVVVLVHFSLLPPVG